MLEIKVDGTPVTTKAGITKVTTIKASTIKVTTIKDKIKDKTKDGIKGIRDSTKVLTKTWVEWVDSTSQSLQFHSIKQIRCK